MEEYDIIIVGAGAAGLMAARELSKKGLKVIVLEARDRTGGRINTLNNSDFSHPVETGAEFIHGTMSITFELLKEGNIPYYTVEGKMGRFVNGKFSSEDSFIKDFPLIIQKLQALKEDISIKEFLDQNFSGQQYESLRKSITGFVEGYDAANPIYASSFSLREEWLSENDSEQYRIKGGYGRLINFLVEECQSRGVVIQLSAIVKKVAWQKGLVEINTNNNLKIKGRKAILTVPLGVLKGNRNEEGYISISPSIPSKFSSLEKMGFGSVIKILFQFKKAFWQDLSGSYDSINKSNRSSKDIGFIFSDAPVPTWWTQLPESVPLLTGWLAGPKAENNRQNNEEILLLALNSLSEIFGLSKEAIEEQLDHWKIINWGKDPFTKGAYAYPTVEDKEAKEEMTIPVENTLFFAGEAYYNGPSLGTVEAALYSGREVARKIEAKR